MERGRCPCIGRFRLHCGKPKELPTRAKTEHSGEHAWRHGSVSTYAEGRRGRDESETDDNLLHVEAISSCSILKGFRWGLVSLLTVSTWNFGSRGIRKKSENFQAKFSFWNPLVASSKAHGQVSSSSPCIHPALPVRAWADCGPSQACRTGAPPMHLHQLAGPSAKQLELLKNNVVRPHQPSRGGRWVPSLAGAGCCGVLTCRGEQYLTAIANVPLCGGARRERGSLGSSSLEQLLISIPAL